MEKEGDLYANTNSCHFLRINDVFYQRVDGLGWRLCPNDQIPDLSKFWPLHEKQRVAYLPALQEKGLL